MAKIKRGTNLNKGAMGIHLFDPTKKQIEDAKEDAINKGFPFVYVHKTRKMVVNRKRR